jgi:enoyl-CoA hydratase/carnithine racemase
LGGPTAAETLFTEMIDMVHRLERLPVPTVLAAHATCLTWGFELALACDLIVAAENVRFGMIERRFALTPAMGGTQRLAARCGVGRASEMVLTAGLYSAADLATWNAINLVLPDEDFVTAARTYAADLATGPGQSHHAAKTILREYVAGGVSAADALTPAISGALFADDEHKRRVSEYLSAHRTAPGGS